MQIGKLLTALPLDDDTLRDTERHFATLLGEDVQLAQRIAPTLLGSIRVEIGGQVYDDSLRGHLRKLRAALLAGKLTDAGTPMDKEHLAKLLTAGLVHAADALQADVPDAGEHANLSSPLETLLRKELSQARRTTVRGAGEVLRVGDGIATVSGMAPCRYGELVELGEEEAPAFGIAMSLNPDSVDVVLISNENGVGVGTTALGTGRVLSVPVGDAMLGRAVNAMGQPIDGLGPIRAEKARPVEAPAPTIIDRQPVTRPLETGILSIDATVPIGRGQRELIIGDRQTGKTSIAVDTVLNQRGKGVLCVYVAIGQKVSTVAQVIETFRKADALSYVTVVCATASDSATMQYLAPYCGCAIAEEFMYAGRDALVIYDDLSKHAVAYRAMSLLLRRPPGREAYPGDVFYLHARLLERAAQLSKESGGGSMTALPIIETQTGDISAYIPTNVISITDGQIFLDNDLFRAGTRPALNVGLSVSRVGGAAQTQAMRKVAGQLRLELAQYRELLVFSQFSSDMDKTTQDMLNYGQRLTEMLKQPNNAPLTTASQVCFLYTMSRGLIPHDIPLDVLRRFKREFPAVLAEQYPDLVLSLGERAQLGEENEAWIHLAVRTWLAQAGIIIGDERA
ncbi:MAG: F0F1 ATP synthase subunit alpha [Oscillospiraceae bacterium]|jgi:F-type H+-transporting ATPase subunit alpha|nr:F0F1 ATP synthase subunit alpha [Oscillospiraceae bacterium]